MEQYDELRAADRETAGKMLAQRFVRNRFANTVVVGIATGGVPVASAIADRLEAPLEVMSCRTIKNPADPARNIGSVSADEIYLQDSPFGPSKDNLYLQIVRLRNEIKYENEFYYGHRTELDFTGKNVIVVDDLLTTPDTLMVAIREIRKQRPARLTVAVPFVEAEAARQIQSACDELVFLKMKQRISSPFEFYNEFSVVNDWSVRDILRATQPELVVAS